MPGFAKKVQKLPAVPAKTKAGLKAAVSASRPRPPRRTRTTGASEPLASIDGMLGFRVLNDGIVKADVRGRLTVGDTASEKQFRILINASGQILLDPVVVMSEREVWLYKNPTALASVMQGLREAADNDVHDLGSFADHA